ncbi:MAG: nuclear transport factor 2 family protein [Mucilaginibacter sp.]|jgi:ketosteroid isomerase-like protein|nr:nuclear transport factor 2 family protein [Mucilaginibacter sp.]
MKKLFIFFLMAMPFVAMSQAHSGYTPSYSSSFVIADPSYSEKILMLWKDFENNTLDKHIDMFADTVTMMLANGAMVKGRTENLAGAKQFRSSLKNYKAALDAWLSVKSTDKNQNVVCVWGTEAYTDKDGKQVKTRLQEVWTFNKDGKIDMMLQYAAPGGM